jgi:Protein of unknown function (DUF4038)/Putative collagen-binding domain of a collagenase
MGQQYSSRGLATISPGPFPLKISPNGRYFTDRNGNPFFFMMDAGWYSNTQLTPAQIDQYLDDRKARGFTAIIVQFTMQEYSSQVPSYENVFGFAPWSTITNTGSPNFQATAVDFSSTVNNFWNNADYVVQGCYRRGMAIVAFPAYSGFVGDGDEWYTPMMADTAAHLQAFGAFFAQRYGSYGHMIVGMSGDRNQVQADMLQNWQIVLGMQSVRNDFLIYNKGARDTSGTAELLSAGGLALYPGFNVNNIYCSNTASTAYTAASMTQTEFARTPVKPLLVDEIHYENDPVSGATLNDVRRAMWSPLCSGAATGCFGNLVLLGFGGATSWNTGAVSPASVLAAYLNTSGAQHASNYAKLVTSYPWQKLASAGVSATLVTTSLGSGAATIVPGLASDGTFAFIYTGSGNGFTVDLSQLSIGSITARWYDPTNGTFTTASGSPFTNTGTHAFTTPGNNSAGDPDWVLVLG